VCSGEHVAVTKGEILDLGFPQSKLVEFWRSANTDERFFASLKLPYHGHQLTQLEKQRDLLY